MHGEQKVEIGKKSSYKIEGQKYPNHFLGFSKFAEAALVITGLSQFLMQTSQTFKHQVKYHVNAVLSITALHNYLMDFYWFYWE